MATQGGYISHGVKVAYSLASPTTWVQLEDVMEVEVPQLVADKVETTTHQTEGRIKTNIAGEQEVTDMRIRMRREGVDANAAGQAALFGLNQNSTSVYWRCEIPASPDPVGDDSYESLEIRGRVGSWQIMTPRPDLVVLEVVVINDGDFYIRGNAAASQI